ncbi:MAG: hypothetical protein V8R46_03390 [Eubacterium ramulus]
MKDTLARLLHMHTQKASVDMVDAVEPAYIMHAQKKEKRKNDRMGSCDGSESFRATYCVRLYS